MDISARGSRRLLAAGFPMVVCDAEHAKAMEFAEMRKDFGLILAVAMDLHLAMPATKAAAVVNDAEVSTGREEDFSAVIRRMERDGGLDNVPASMQ